VMRVLYWIVLALIALALALFAASNREAVSLGFWPLGLALELPLYLAILLTFFTGLRCGAVAAWVGGRHWRSEARRTRRRVTALESELEATQAQLAGPRLPPPGRPAAPEFVPPPAAPSVPPPAPIERAPSVPARG
jgi:uncharacterized integral membrane protein